MYDEFLMWLAYVGLWKKCLCNMPEDAGHAFCRCAMTWAFEFA